MSRSLPEQGNTVFNGDERAPTETNLRPTALAIDRDGMLLIADGSGRLRRLNTSNTPRPATMLGPADGATLSGTSQTFRWSTGVGVEEYYFKVGSEPFQGDIYSASQGKNTSVTVDNLPTDGRKLYVRIDSKISGEWQGTGAEYLASGVDIGGTAERGVIQTPREGSQLEGTTETFEWSPGISIEEFYLRIGSAPGSDDIHSKSYGTSMSATVFGLPTDGRPLYVQLRSRTGDDWLEHELVYLAADREIRFEPGLGGDRAWVFSMPFSVASEDMDWGEFFYGVAIGHLTGEGIAAIFGVSSVGGPVGWGLAALGVVGEFFKQYSEFFDPTRVAPLLAAAELPDDLQAELNLCLPGDTFSAIAVLDHVRVWEKGGSINRWSMIRRFACIFTKPARPFQTK